MKSLPVCRSLPVALCLMAVAVAPAAAQEVPAESNPPAVEPAASTGSPEGSIEYTDAEGIVRGTLAIRQVADPFTAFESTQPPPEGQRYVQLIVTFEASEDQTFAAEPAYVVLQDADGYLYSPAYLPRPPDALPPDVQSQTLSPFDRVSGSIGYRLPVDAITVRMLYRGDGSRLVTISEPGSEGAPAPGQPRTVRGPDGLEQGSVAILGVADPYTDHEPTQPPAEGQRYILVTAAFEAAEDASMWAEPAGLLLLDTSGWLHYPRWIPRPAGQLMQDLDRQALSPSDRISGVMGYVVAGDVVVERLIYAPEPNRYLTVADLAAGD